MKIGVDARPLVHARIDGIPRFLRGLLSALSRLDRDNEYLLYAPRDFAWEGAPDFRCSKRLGPAWPGAAWMQAALPFLLKRDRADIFWGTQHTLPLLASLPQVLTVHDMVYKVHPRTMAAKNRWLMRCLAGSSVRRATAVAAISANTARDLRRFVSFKAAVHVVPNGVEESFRAEDKAAARRKVREAYGVEGPFLLVVGTLEPRKNLTASLRALALLPDLPHVLCVAGRVGWGDILARSPELARVKDRVRLLGPVGDAELRSLYTAADVFLFPSLYEGFGLPPLEAMACGTPVAASDASCLPEVLGTAALFSAPHDAGALAGNIRRLIMDVPLRDALVRAGLERAGGYSWDRTARQMIDIFQRTC